MDARRASGELGPAAFAREVHRTRLRALLGSRPSRHPSGGRTAVGNGARCQARLGARVARRLAVGPDRAGEATGRWRAVRIWSPTRRPLRTLPPRLRRGRASTKARSRFSSPRCPLPSHRSARCFTPAHGASSSRPPMIESCKPPWHSATRTSRWQLAAGSTASAPRRWMASGRGPASFRSTPTIHTQWS